MSLFTLVCLILVVWIDDPRVATLIFLVLTCAESGLFSLLYFLLSDWKNSAASRAIMWITTAYFLLSGHIVISFLYKPDYPLRDDIQQFLYLLLCIAGLNLVLTVIRLQQETRAQFLKKDL